MSEPIAGEEMPDSGSRYLDGRVPGRMRFSRVKCVVSAHVARRPDQASIVLTDSPGLGFGCDDLAWPAILADRDPVGRWEGRQDSESRVGRFLPDFLPFESRRYQPRPAVDQR